MERKASAKCKKFTISSKVFRLSSDKTACILLLTFRIPSNFRYQAAWPAFCVFLILLQLNLKNIPATPESQHKNLTWIAFLSAYVRQIPLDYIFQRQSMSHSQRRPDGKSHGLCRCQRFRLHSPKYGLPP